MTGRAPRSAVIFDLDGTLVDSRVAVVGAVAAGIEETARRHGRGSIPIDPAKIRSALGLPATEYFRTILDERLRDLSEEVKTAATAHEVAALERGEGRLFPSVLPTLDALRGRGHALAVVSNAQAPYFHAALDALDLRRRLDHAQCHEELPPKTPAPFKRALVERALRRLGIEGAHAWMVGDRREDVEAGRTWHCRTVGVRFGFGAEEEFADADHVIDRFDQLLGVVSPGEPLNDAR